VEWSTEDGGTLVASLVKTVDEGALVFGGLMVPSLACTPLKAAQGA